MCDIAWEEYKPILRRAYFGDGEGCLALRESDNADDFWRFFRKYVGVAGKKRVRADRSREWRHASADNPLEIPETFSKFHQVNVKLTQQELPIAAHRSEILAALEENSTLIIAGDTGCGKSTQPRRIACTSLSKRVGYETLGEFASQIAYQIRFEKTKTAATKMLFLTEGLLLRQMSADPMLKDYQVIILDEVHERNLQGDFLMGMLRQLVSERTDLKLILMSATINLDLFKGYFKDAPVVQVPGRLYPIQLQYFPVAQRDRTISGKEVKNDKIDPAPYRRILSMIDTKFPATERGDALIFLSGISEMTMVAEALKAYAEQNKRWIIMMLHSTLSLEEQDKVFDVAPEGVRKAILSTNIAETSVTIDGVRFVVDSGKVKEMRYDSATRMHQLKEIWVSQASANQRKGRAGRTGPGVCYRLYDEQEFDAFAPFSTSEILRVSLDSLVLQMYHLQLPSPRHFDFIEPPNANSLNEAIEGLKDQGALQHDRSRGGDADELTPLGRMLVNLPVDVGIGKMLIMGCLFQQVEVILTVAASLSVQSPFTQRSYRDPDCAAARRHLLSDHGDPFCLVRVYKEWLKVKADGEDTRKWCRKRGIEEQRLYEITKLRRQFKELLEDSDLIEKKSMESQGVVGSAERRIRAGEVKKLRDLKRKFQFEQRKRKVLKANEHFDTFDSQQQTEDDFGAGGIGNTSAEKAEGSGGKSRADVGAVEFALKVTGRDLSDTIRSHHLDWDSSFVVKCIACSALYPQYAVLDQYNNYKVGCDQLMIFYGLLLETMKPYLINTLRVPALHILLLFARQIDASADCTRIICDEFVEFILKKTEDAQEIIAQSSDIRKLMGKSLERKLDGDTYRSDRLGRKIVRYMRLEVIYCVKRLSPVDRRLFFPSSVIPDETTAKKEGHVTDFLSMGVVPNSGQSVGTTSQFLSVRWTCASCGEDYYSNSVEKLEHIRECGKKVVRRIGGDVGENDDEGPMRSDDSDGAGDSEDEEAKQAKRSMQEQEDRNPLKQGYYCSDCKETLKLTPIEILKHKRSHSSA